MKSGGQLIQAVPFPLHAPGWTSRENSSDFGYYRETTGQSTELLKSMLITLLIKPASALESPAYTGLPIRRACV
jgi:hypothetical protein